MIGAIAYGLVVLFVAFDLAAQAGDSENWIRYVPRACWWPFLIFFHKRNRK